MSVRVGLEIYDVYILDLARFNICLETRSNTD